MLTQLDIVYIFKLHMLRDFCLLIGKVCRPYLKAVTLLYCFLLISVQTQVVDIFFVMVDKLHFLVGGGAKLQMGLLVDKNSPKATVLMFCKNSFVSNFAIF